MIDNKDTKDVVLFMITKDSFNILQTLITLAVTAEVEGANKLANLSQTGTYDDVLQSISVEKEISGWRQTLYKFAYNLMVLAIGNKFVWTTRDQVIQMGKWSGN